MDKEHLMHSIQLLAFSFILLLGFFIIHNQTKIINTQVGITKALVSLKVEIDRTPVIYSIAQKKLSLQEANAAP